LNQIATNKALHASGRHRRPRNQRLNAPDANGRVIATFVIDASGTLKVADRRSEHVLCAGGVPVRSAGEVTFAIQADRVAVVAVSNQSTGYCPEPESWNALSWFVTALIAVALAFLNLDGYQLHVASPWGRGDVVGEPPVSNWVHGWPIGFAVRSSIYSVHAGRGAKVQSFTGEHGLYSRWPFDDSPVSAFSVLAASGNLLICALLLIGTFVGTRKLAGRLKLHLQFTLRALLICVLASAVLVAGREWFFASRYVLETIAVLSIAFAGCMCAYSTPWEKWRSNAHRASSRASPRPG
jgi:hypothetical protein